MNKHCYSDFNVEVRSKIKKLGRSISTHAKFNEIKVGMKIHIPPVCENDRLELEVTEISDYWIYGIVLNPSNKYTNKKYVYSYDIMSNYITIIK